MPSQDEYLDNVNENENTEGQEAANAAEENVPHLDMSDMDDLLKSALDAGQEAAPEEQPAAEDTVHPEETASMSEDEINNLLQKSQEQAESAQNQENFGENDDLIKMLENADDEGLSNLLDQVAPEPAVAEDAAEQPEEDGGRRRKKRKKKEKAPKDKDAKKKPGFFARFKKKSKEEPQTPEDEAGAASAGALEENGAEIPAGVPEDLADLASLTEATGNADVAASEPENTTAADNMAGGAGGVDDELDALLAGAFPQQDSTESVSGEPESADVMDILKAAGADIVEEPEKKKEKKGFFAKLLDLFTEEDEDEEEAGQLQLSDENKKILEEMDKGGKKKKGKKEKKPKKEKQPKPKKPAKEKKKKEKKEKPEQEGAPEVPQKRISPKKIIPIVVVCISLGAAILLLGNFLTDYIAKREGREAYYAGDYQTCYQNLLGKELDETEQVMYSQSESILTIRMWLREYEVFVSEDSELEALDSLLQAVKDYPTLLVYATKWNAQDEVSSAFQDILNILSQKYQLSQDEAERIAGISDDVEYTKNVMMILQKLGLGSWEFPQGTMTVETPAPAQSIEEQPVQLPDLLPEEMEIQQ